MHANAVASTRSPPRWFGRISETTQEIRGRGKRTFATWHSLSLSVPITPVNTSTATVFQAKVSPKRNWVPPCLYTLHKVNTIQIKNIICHCMAFASLSDAPFQLVRAVLSCSVHRYQAAVLFLSVSLCMIDKLYYLVTLLYKDRLYDRCSTANALTCLFVISHWHFTCSSQFYSKTSRLNTQKLYISFTQTKGKARQPNLQSLHSGHLVPTVALEARWPSWLWVRNSPLTIRLRS